MFSVPGERDLDLSWCYDGSRSCPVGGALGFAHNIFDPKPISSLRLSAGQAPCAVSGQVGWPQARGICGCHWQPFCPAEHSDYRHRQHHPEGRQGTGHQDRHRLHPDRRHHQRELSNTYTITTNSLFFGGGDNGLDNDAKILNTTVFVSYFTL